MNGDDGIDLLRGDEGDDTLDGGDGDDALLGGEGQDTLIGGAGNDRLFGETGDDLMTGGAGADVFFFAANSGHDRIVDFTVGEDVMRFTGLGLSFADLGFQDVGGDLKISIPSDNGDDILLLGLAGEVLNGGSFIF